MFLYFVEIIINISYNYYDSNAMKGRSIMSTNRLKLLLKVAKKTQKDIAGVVNITQNAYSYWETGKVNIDAESLKKLAEFYGVSLDFLSGLPFDVTKTVETWSKEQQEEYYTADENKKTYLEYLWGAPIFNREGTQSATDSKILRFHQGDMPVNNAFLSDHELKVIDAYRRLIQMQPAIDRLLGIADDDQYSIYAAAKSKDNKAPRIMTKSKEEWERIENAPDTDDDLL